MSEFSSKRDYQTAQSADGQLKVPTPIDGSTPIKLTFKDVCYEVTVKKSKQERDTELPMLPGQQNSRTKKLQVLKNCTGFAAPGQTTYIMGASGAGKTSLLNAISDRIKITPGSSKLTG